MLNKFSVSVTLKFDSSIWLLFQDYIHKAKRTITIVIGSTIASAIILTVIALLVWWFYRRRQQEFVSLDQDILHGGEYNWFISSFKMLFHLHFSNTFWK